MYTRICMILFIFNFSGVIFNKSNFSNSFRATTEYTSTYQMFITININMNLKSNNVINNIFPTFQLNLCILNRTLFLSDKKIFYFFICA